MSTNENAPVPVRATLYEHQKSAVKFALRLLLPQNGGDALSSISGAGCALLMEM